MDWVTQILFNNVDDKYLLYILIAWIVSNVIILIWHTPPKEDSKYRVLYNVVFRISTLIPPDVMLRRLASRKGKKEVKDDDDK